MVKTAIELRQYLYHAEKAGKLVVLMPEYYFTLKNRVFLITGFRSV
jgi:hypothetical protein